MRVAAVLSLFVAGCFSPRFRDDLQCGPGAECPNGFRCELASNRCLAGRAPADAAVDAQEDFEPPTVVDVSPLDGATNVSPLLVVTVRFSEPLDPRTVTRDHFRVVRSAGGSAASGTFSEGVTDTIRFYSRPLEWDTEYLLELDAGLTDLAGNALVPRQSRFRTQQQPDGVRNSLEASDEDAFDPAVAFVRQDPVVVWLQSEGAQLDVVASKRENSVWSTPVVIESYAGVPTAPRIVNLGNGDALAVWTQNTAFGRDVVSARYRGSSGWDPPMPAENLLGVVSSVIEVAADGRGNAFVVFVADPGALYGARLVASAGWEPPHQIAARVKAFRLASSNGDATILWSSGAGEPLAVNVTRYRDAIGWDRNGPLQLAGGTDEVEDLAITYDVLGNAMAVWSRTAADVNPKLWYARDDKMMGSGWSAAAALDSEPGGSFQPSVALGGNLNGAMVWSHRTPAPVLQILGRRFVHPTGWQPSQIIDVTGTGDSPSIALDTNSRGYAVWRERIAGRKSVVAAQYVDMLGFQGPFLLENDDAGDTGAPAIVVEPTTGEGVAVWDQSDGAKRSIFAYSFR